MERLTIAKAIETLQELYEALVAAYWDANDVYQKDTIFDTLSVIHFELNELYKLSVDDHSMGYEPVTDQFPGCAKKFKVLQTHLDDWFPRTSTARNLGNTLAAANNLISPKYL